MYRIKWKFGGVIIMPHVVVKLWPGRNDEITTRHISIYCVKCLLIELDGTLE